MSEYIGREFTRELLNEIKRRVPDDMETCVQVTIDAIKSIPAADVEPVVRGIWGLHTYTDDMEIGKFFACSNCKGRVELQTRRCPYCGAHMERSGSGE